MLGYNMCYLFVYFTCLKKKNVQISTGTTVQISTGTWTRFNQWKFIYMASADDQLNIRKKTCSTFEKTEKINFCVNNLIWYFRVEQVQSKLRSVGKPEG